MNGQPAKNNSPVGGDSCTVATGVDRRCNYQIPPGFGIFDHMNFLENFIHQKS
jgi:hypothetical protein